MVPRCFGSSCCLQWVMEPKPQGKKKRSVSLTGSPDSLYRLMINQQWKCKVGGEKCLCLLQEVWSWIASACCETTWSDNGCLNSECTRNLKGGYCVDPLCVCHGHTAFQRSLLLGQQTSVTGHCVIYSNSGPQQGMSLSNDRDPQNHLWHPRCGTYTALGMVGFPPRMLGGAGKSERVIRRQNPAMAAATLAVPGSCWGLALIASSMGIIAFIQDI